MQNYDHLKHRRGSSPPPTQSEEELHGNGKVFNPGEQDPADFQTARPGKMTAVVPDPPEQPENPGRWQDTGGESG